jgi:hypothetical protein
MSSSGSKRKDSGNSRRDTTSQSMFQSLNGDNEHTPAADRRSHTSRMNSRRRMREEELTRRGFTEPVSVPHNANGGVDDDPLMHGSPDPTPPSSMTPEFHGAVIFPVRRRSSNHLQRTREASPDARDALAPVPVPSSAEVIL